VRPGEQGSPPLHGGRVVTLALVLGSEGVWLAVRAFSDRAASSHAERPDAAMGNGLSEDFASVTDRHPSP
jgi:hypothetical protein